MTLSAPNQFFSSGQPLMLISHAGDTASGAEPGTMTAYQRAYDLGFRAFQVDIVSAPDNTLLSMHAVFGRKFGFATKSLDEVRTSAGSDVPTLSELFAAFGDVRWNIEVKSTQCEPALRKLIADFPQIEKLCISAPFHTRLLRRLRRESPDLATNASLLEGALFGINLLPWRRRSAPGIQLFLPIARRFIVRRNVRRGQVVHVWTVNDAAVARRLHGFGVSGLVVDDYESVAGAVTSP